jgi:hypothetical protein
VAAAEVESESRSGSAEITAAQAKIPADRYRNRCDRRTFFVAVNQAPTISKPLNIRELVRRGPNDRDDVEVIVAVAMRDVSGNCETLKQRLSESLMEMLLCPALHTDCIEARAEALAAVNGIENMRVKDQQSDRIAKEATPWQTTRPKQMHATEAA